ncbi:DNA polymerase III epsilon subunit, exonuclease domain [actinobacterium SCGC AAA044-D11]
MNRFAVVDTETTGFGKNDRILEIGIVLVDGNEIVQEWETLINPERDISNSNIHGITSELVSLAPTFSEVIDEISGFLDDRIFVAHNVAFDSKMLEFEFNKADKLIDFGKPFCTLQATKMKLEKACEEYGVKNLGAHRALTDARATALILAQVMPDEILNTPARIQGYDKRTVARTISRSAFDDNHFGGQQNMRRISRNHETYGAEGPILSYMDALSSLLSDFKLTKDESVQLDNWALELGLTEKEISQAKSVFVKTIISAAERDNFISPTELDLMIKIAAELGVEFEFKNSIQSEEIQTPLVSGVRVCFTGTARDENGEEITREFLESVALSRGLVLVSSVTKKSCDLLVASDKSSMSGKAKKARDFGITVISVSEFIERI